VSNFRNSSMTRASERPNCPALLMPRGGSRWEEEILPSACDAPEAAKTILGHVSRAMLRRQMAPSPPLVPEMVPSLESFPACRKKPSATRLAVTSYNCGIQKPCHTPLFFLHVPWVREFLGKLHNKKHERKPQSECINSGRGIRYEGLLRHFRGGLSVQPTEPTV
jgi:hypothetical protein